MIVHVMKIILANLFLLILSGCQWQETESRYHDGKAPDAVPEMSLGRVLQLPEMDDQLLVEVVVVNKGKRPVALDLNRFSVELMSLDPADSPESLFGWFDSLGETCVTTFPADSSNRFVLATSYIGACNTNSSTDWEERRWSERRDMTYHFGLYYAPPSQSRIDYLWTVKNFKNRQQVAVEVGTCDVYFFSRIGNPSPSWERWRSGRTNDPQKIRSR